MTFDDFEKIIVDSNPADWIELSPRVEGNDVIRRAVCKPDIRILLEWGRKASDISSDVDKWAQHAFAGRDYALRTGQILFAGELVAEIACFECDRIAFPFQPTMMPLERDWKMKVLCLLNGIAGHKDYWRFWQEAGYGFEDGQQ